MQNDKIFSEILSTLVKTRYEANLLLDEIEILERASFKIGEEDFESSLKKAVRAKTAYAIEALLKSGNRDEVLKSLKLKINSLNYLNLTIAFEPSLETINRFYVWAKQNLGDGIALNISIDKSILGGAVIEFKGKVSSFTLIKKIEDYFLNTNVNV
jgi:F0F1-type ATP synthase delta subunit